MKMGLVSAMRAFSIIILIIKYVFLAIIHAKYAIIPNYHALSALKIVLEIALLMKMMEFVIALLVISMIN